MLEQLRTVAWSGGVQSTAIVAMAALGDLPPIDWAVYIDVRCDLQRTYAALDWWQPWLEARGIRVARVDGGHLIRDGVIAHTHVPFWYICPYTGKKQRLKRQCSGRFRIAPIRRWIREALGYHPSRNPYPPAGSVRHWVGLSADEARRLPSGRGWRPNYLLEQYPLIDLGITRADCVTWLQRHRLPVPVRSACVICPLKGPEDWLRMRRDEPRTYRRVVAFDNWLRGRLPDRELFVYLNRETRMPEPLGTGIERLTG